MDEFKITISRGYTRKVNLGNYIKTRPYESTDFFANYSREISVGAQESRLKALSKELYDMARQDVDIAVSRYLMEEINKIPRQSDKHDKRQKSENSFIEDLDNGINDLGDI